MKATPRISSFTLIVAFLCAALAGMAFIPLLPVKLSPSRTLPKLNIRFTMPGNSARIIEMEATSRLEAMLARIKGIKEITSVSGNGWGTITLELDKHADPDAARFEASTIIRQTWPRLPGELTYPVLEMSRPDDKEERPFMAYTLNAPASPAFIQRFAEEQIKPRLASLPGIYRIDISGATPMEWQLEYDSRQLSLLGITVDDLRQALLQYEQKEFLGLANRASAESEAGAGKSPLSPAGGPEASLRPGRDKLSPSSLGPERPTGGATGFAEARGSDGLAEATGSDDFAEAIGSDSSVEASGSDDFAKAPSSDRHVARPSNREKGPTPLSRGLVGAESSLPVTPSSKSPASSGEWVRLALVSDPGTDGLDVSRITVKNQNGTLIRLDQLLRVTRQEEEPQSYYRINGLNSIYLSIRAEETANQLRLAGQVKGAMQHIRSLLPAGYEIHTSYDATEFIREELNKIYVRTGLTVLILLLFVLLITRNLRYLLLIVVSLGVNLCIAVIFFYLLRLEMQLYSLAGVTISLSLVIDNTIVMTDHIRNRHDRKAFLAILTATLTTIGALVIIFFLDEKIRLNLQDFAAVVIVNLGVSLAVALWLVPALIEKMGLENKRPRSRRSGDEANACGMFSPARTAFPIRRLAGGKSVLPHEPLLRSGDLSGGDPSFRTNLSSDPATCRGGIRPSVSRSAFRSVRRLTRRFPVYFSRYYEGQIRFLGRWKKTACLLLVLAFGLPVFLLPEKIDLPEKNAKDAQAAGDRSARLYGARRANRSVSAFREKRQALDSLFIVAYNRLAANDTYKETVKPILDKALGGTLRLFVQKVYEGSYFTRNDETVLSVGATLPNGSTLSQMNHLIGRMETFLSTCSGIRQFQTQIYNARQAGIYIYFTRESERSGYPYTLKSQIVGKALELGGGSWNVWGLQDQGFSNDVRENAGSFRIEMYGYNYDELYEWAERLKARLLTYRRIKEVSVDSEFSWWKDDYREFYFRLAKARLAQEGLRPEAVFATLAPAFGKNLYSGNVVVEGETEKLKLSSRQAREYDIWSMQYMPWQTAAGRTWKLSDVASVEKGQVPQEVAKINQQYRLCLQYEYIGANTQGVKIQKRVLDEFNRLLPMGYTAKASAYDWSWAQQGNSHYSLLLLIIAIIFFTTSILFNSLRQPLAVIFVIPISYIGVFLTFYGFKLNFDQGGFASFVLLCGITVNASIYILNEYNRLRDRFPRLSPRRAYLKAWNAKITPIFLTVISTILGFIPFMLGPDKEAFWFPLAAGTIGGLAMSIAGIFIYLPLFTVPKASG